MKCNLGRLSSCPLHPRPEVWMLRTLLAVVAVLAVYTPLGRNPCFACIGAVFGMGSVAQGGLACGGNRFAGTLLGGLLVVPFYWLYHLSPWPAPRLLYLLAGLFLILYIGALFGAAGAIQPGTVVYFVVLFTVPADRYIRYTADRILDTGVGVLISLGLGALLSLRRCKAPPKK